jgi:4'-phosphopantetheinyl transferase
MERPDLSLRAAHVWRVPLDASSTDDQLWLLLSSAEQTRARSFVRADDQRRFIVAHGMLRRILGAYEDAPPASLAFVTSEHGKPSLAGPAQGGIEFNLSHSGEIALVAVARGRAVGVDVERWDAHVEHRDLAERFFSRRERTALAALADSSLVEGFFAAWSRKEAYLKASGLGITRGLHNFDVSLAPGQPAALLADQLDATAAERWVMRSITLAPGHSAALVVAAPLDEVVLIEAR